MVDKEFHSDKKQFKVIGIIVISAIALFSLWFLVEQSANDNRFRTKSEIYLNNSSRILEKLTETSDNFRSTTKRYSQGEIASSQAAEIYSIHKSKLKGYRSEFKSLNPPEEYERYHERMSNGISLFYEAIKVAESGARQNNRSLISKSSKKLDSANSEIATANEILKTIGN